MDMKPPAWETRVALLSLGLFVCVFALTVLLGQE